MTKSLRCLIDNDIGIKELLDQIKMRYKASLTLDNQNFNGEVSGTIDVRNNEEATTIYFIYSKPSGRIFEGLTFKSEQVLGMISDVNNFSSKMFEELLADYGGYLLDEREHLQYQRTNSQTLFGYDDFQR